MFENTFKNETLESAFLDFIEEHKLQDLSNQEAKIHFINETLLQDGSETLSDKLSSNTLILNDDNYFYSDLITINTKHPQELQNLTFLKIIDRDNLDENSIYNILKELILEVKNIYKTYPYKTNKELQKAYILTSEIQTSLEIEDDSIRLIPSIALFIPEELGEARFEMIRDDFEDLKRKNFYGSNLNLEIYTENSIYKNIARTIGGIFVERDSIFIDKANNILRFDNENSMSSESIVCNASAKSIKELWNKYKNDLLGLNLRFFVDSKKHDNKVKDSILNDSKNFWYKNNGLVIICESFKIKRDKIVIENFSIINGGQTTYTLGQADFDDDFYLTCKIIQINDLKNSSSLSSVFKFATSIATATNSQKKISNSDLMANNEKVLEAKEAFESPNSNNQIFLQTRKGQYKFSPRKKEFKAYKLIDADKLVQIENAFYSLLPGGSRNGKSKLVESENKINNAFREVIKNVNIYKDLVAFHYVQNEIKKAKKIQSKFRHKYYLDFVSYYMFHVITAIKFIFAFEYVIKRNRFEEFDNLLDIIDDYNLTPVRKAEKCKDWLQGKFNPLMMNNKLFVIDTKDEKSSVELEHLYDYLIEEELIYVYEKAFDKYAYSLGGSGQASKYSVNDNNFYNFFLRELLTMIMENKAIPENYYNVLNLKNVR